MKQKVKGWKCFDQDLSCRGFQFEIGKTYEIEGDLKMCSNGFHFHEKAEHLFNYYEDNFLHTVVCEIEAEDVITDNNKSVCRKIKLVKKLSGIEVKSVYSDGSGYGYGYGSGYGSGDGSGYGYGYGSGDGSGYGYGYLTYKNNF